MTSEDLRIIKSRFEMEYMVFDRLSLHARRLINEHGDPGIERLIQARVPGSVIIDEVEAWAQAMPQTSQPQPST